MLYKENKTETKGTADCDAFGLVQAQLAREFQVEKTYIAIAVWAQANYLPELGSFFMSRAAEEKSHAVRHINFLLQNGKTPKIESKPDETPTLDCIDCCLDHTYFTEKAFTKNFAEMYKAAVDEAAGTVINFALEFLEEQREEEAWALSLVNMWQTCGGSKVDFEVFIHEFNKSDKVHHGTGTLG